MWYGLFGYLVTLRYVTLPYFHTVLVRGEWGARNLIEGGQLRWRAAARYATLRYERYFTFIPGTRACDAALLCVPAARRMTILHALARYFARLLSFF
jgi:hypothetical protein